MEKNYYTINMYIRERVKNEQRVQGNCCRPVPASTVRASKKIQKNIRYINDA